MPELQRDAFVSALTQYMIQPPYVVAVNLRVAPY